MYLRLLSSAKLFSFYLLQLTTSLIHSCTFSEGRSYHPENLIEEEDIIERLAELAKHNDNQGGCTETNHLLFFYIKSKTV